MESEVPGKVKGNVLSVIHRVSSIRKPYCLQSDRSEYVYMQRIGSLRTVKRMLEFC